MMFKISRDYIKTNCTGYSMDRGLELYLGKRVRSSQYNPKRGVFTATVVDGRERGISLAFDADGQLAKWQCACRPPQAYRRAAADGMGFCEHAVATLMFVQKRDEQGLFGDIREKEKAKQIFELFNVHSSTYAQPADGQKSYAYAQPASGQTGGEGSLDAYFVRESGGGDISGASIGASTGASIGASTGAAIGEIRQQARLHATWADEGDPPDNEATRASFTFKASIGSGEAGASAATIKNLPGFMRSIAAGSPAAIAKRVSLDPALHFFTGFDASLAEFLADIYEVCFVPFSESLHIGALVIDTTRKLLKTTIPMQDKWLRLTESQLRRLLLMHAKHGRPLSLDMPSTGAVEEAPVLEKEIRMDFRLRREGNGLILKIDAPTGLIPLTKGGWAFYFNGAVHIPPRQQAAMLLTLAKTLSAYSDTEFRFAKEDQSRFVSEVLPAIDEMGSLVIDDEVATLIDHRDLMPEIYLDREDGAVTADVRFIYGDLTINPFAAASGPSPGPAAASDAILVRDVRAETRILDILAETDFKVRNNKISLHDDESIYDFIVSMLPRLQRHAEVYYSQEFRRLAVRRAIGFKVTMSFGESDLLQFDFDAGNVSREELWDILASIRVKKRYYKLKDGTLLDIANKEAQDVVELLDYIGASRSDVLSGSVALPGFRALYLDYFLRNSAIKDIGRNKLFRDFVRSLSEPGDDEREPPRSVGAHLRDYQKAGFRWLAALSEYSLGGILADDMGLGKTVQVLTLLLSVKEGAKNSGASVGASVGVSGTGTADATDATSATSTAGTAGDGSVGDGSVGDSPADDAPPGGARDAHSLIVVPTSLVYNWCAEIDKFTPQLSYLVVAGSKAERARLITKAPEYDVVVTSYPLMRRDYEDYKDIRFHFCILDEAQHIKNPASHNAMSVKCLNARSRFALTGTPMENRLLDLWSIFDYVLPGYLLSEKAFASRYSIAYAGVPNMAAASAAEPGHTGAEPGHAGAGPGHADAGPGQNSTGLGHADAEPGHADAEPGQNSVAPRLSPVGAHGAMGELSNQIRPFILRRLKTDVLRELPEKIDTTMYAEFEPAQRRLYAAYVEKIRFELSQQIDGDGFRRHQIEILAALTRLRQICCHPALFVEGYGEGSGKLALLQEVIGDALDGGHRILLFSQFTSMLAIIRRWADKEGIKYSYIDGDVSAADRHKAVNAFNDGEGDMFLISLKAGGAGLNLTGADTVIHYDPWWNPAVEDQATDRAYRIGQKKTVQVIKLLTAGSVEEKIFAMQERKKQLIEAVIKPGETFLSKLSRDDLDEILSFG